MGEVRMTEKSTETRGNLHFLRLQEQLEQKSAIIGVIGLGYVGLPLVQTIHGAGYRVVGFDTDVEKVKKLQSGQTYIRHVKPEVTNNLARSERFNATSSFADLSECHVLIICLPTPVGVHNEPDMSFVMSTAKDIGRILVPARLIVLESTTYPGATDEDLVKILGESNLICGEDFFVAYSPEREDPGNTKFKTHAIPKLVGGVDEKSGDLVELLYRNGGFENTVRVSSARIAECAKLLENTYRAVNIALVNELKQVFESMGINIWEVLDAAETKPFGFQRFDPGPGIGGHCIPIDPFYLTWRAKETGAPCDFIELAAVVNARMPSIVVNKVQAALNLERKCVNGSRILILGIAYKPDVDDIREAPSLAIWELLLDLGAIVRFHDPYIPVVCQTRRHSRLSQERSAEVRPASELEKYDAVILVTHHSCFKDYSFLRGFRGPVVDTRNKIPERFQLNVLRA